MKVGYKEPSSYFNSDMRKAEKEWEKKQKEKKKSGTTQKKKKKSK